MTEQARLHSFSAALAIPGLHSTFSRIESTHPSPSSRFPKSEFRLLKSLDPSKCEGTPRENSINEFSEKYCNIERNFMNFSHKISNF